jgi:transcriptional regulator with XRE-family HTH domain
MTKEQIVEKIQRLRMEKGYSMCKLAKLSGISQTGYNHIELRKTDMNVQTLQKICDALEISMSEFFNEPIEHIPDKQQWYLVALLAPNDNIIKKLVPENNLEFVVKYIRETDFEIIAISEIGDNIRGFLETNG